MEDEEDDHFDLQQRQVLPKAAPTAMTKGEEVKVICVLLLLCSRFSQPALGFEGLRVLKYLGGVVDSKSVDDHPAPLPYQDSLKFIVHLPSNQDVIYMVTVCFEYMRENTYCSFSHRQISKGIHALRLSNDCSKVGHVLYIVEAGYLCLSGTLHPGQHRFDFLE